MYSKASRADKRDAEGRRTKNGVLQANLENEIFKLMNKEEHIRGGIVFLFATCIFMLTAAVPAWGGEDVLTMSTTTSTRASGLLDVLLPEFEKDEGIKVKVIAKGTGAAIRDGVDGNVDIIFVHAKAREEKFVNEGYGVQRHAVMHNDFVILGPVSDPACIRGVKSAAEALKKIALTEQRFISRGDDSGTHAKEQELWEVTGLALAQKTRTIVKKGKKKNVVSTQPAAPRGWYFSIGQGMGKTITFADEKHAYVLADRGTYIKYKYGKTPSIDLEALCEGGILLENPYGIIPVSPKKHPHVRYDLAMKFAAWITSLKGQKLIYEYRLADRQLFYPDAVRTATE